MEMAPMMTKSQDANALMPGMAAAGNGPPRQPAAPLPFAAKLQEFMPPARGGADPAETAVKPMPTGKGILPGKGKACINSATGQADDNGAVEEQSTDPVASQLARLLAMAGQLPAGQTLPKPDGQAASQASELKVGGWSNSSGLAEEGTGGGRLTEGRLAIVSAGLNAGDDPLTLHQSGHTALVSASPAGMADGSEAVDAPGQAGEAAQSKEAHASGELGTTRVQGGQPAFKGVQAHATPEGSLPFIEQNPAGEAPQGKMPIEPSGAPASQAAAAVVFAAHSKLQPAAQEGWETTPVPGAGVATGNQANPLVEVVFTDPSARGRSPEGNEHGDPGAKEKEKESPPGLGVAATRTIDASNSNRFVLQPKAEESRNALHDSILSQVKESVFSHDGKGNGTITVKLNPGDLGDLQINVRIENQRVKVEVITENRTVRDALMGNLDNLKETFLKQNLNMERFNVSSGEGNGFGQGFREEKGDQRPGSSLPFGHEAVPIGIVRENDTDDWGVTENSLVNLRL